MANAFLQNLKTSFVDPFKKPLPAIGSTLAIPKPTTQNVSGVQMSTPTVPNMSYSSTPNMSVNPPKPLAPVAPKASSFNQGVYDQQVSLNAKGAGLKTDGIMGPLTQDAITKYSTPTKSPTVTYDGKNINPATGGISDTPVPPPTYSAPEAPAVPKVDPYQTAVSDAEKAYMAAGTTTPEEDSTQAELDRLQNSFKTGYQGIQDKVIPMEFITGQSRSLENRALNLAEPLQAKLARLEAKRTSALETSKFALDRADAKLKAENDKKTTKQITLGAGESVGQYDPATGTYKNSFTAPYKPENPDKSADPNRVLSVDEAKNLGLPFGTTASDAYGTKPLDPNSPVTSPEKSMDQINLVKSSLERAKSLAGASGRSGIRKTAESWFLGSSDYTNLVAETNTLRTNVLTLMTDPTIKKFFGPQMSNADVQLMTSAGTTLNPELQNADNMRSELTRLEDLIARAEKAVQQGTAGGTSGGVVQTKIGAINTNW